jgi:hypothetical protein
VTIARALGGAPVGARSGSIPLDGSMVAITVGGGPALGVIIVQMRAAVVRTAIYLCNQHIYSPIRRRGGGPYWSLGRPTGRFDVWFSTMSTSTVPKRLPGSNRCKRITISAVGATWSSAPWALIASRGMTTSLSSNSSQGVNGRPSRALPAAPRTEPLDDDSTSMACGFGSIVRGLGDRPLDHKGDITAD